jgi:hypothetical protein
MSEEPSYIDHALARINTGWRVSYGRLSEQWFIWKTDGNAVIVCDTPEAALTAYKALCFDHLFGATP